MPATMRAISIGRARRRPKTYGDDRTCNTKGCEVRLSRYNRAEHCFNHAPARFPRLRGEFTQEWSAKQS